MNPDTTGEALMTVDLRDECVCIHCQRSQQKALDLNIPLDWLCARCGKQSKLEAERSNPYGVCAACLEKLNEAEQATPASIPLA